MGKVGLEQVAKRAGVSVATVDRVLNSRPGVRPETAARVDEVVRELNYRPSSLAARMARIDVRRFLFLLPNGSNEFFQSIEHDVRSASDRSPEKGLEVELRHIDVFNGHRLAEALDGVGDDYGGVATVALDHPAVRDAIDTLVGRGVHVVTLVSDLPGSRRARFIGIDNHAAGRTAASLLGRFCGGKKGKVGLIAGSLALRDHAERKFGFEQVLSQEYDDLEVLPALEGFDDDDRSQTAAQQILNTEPELVALYSAGAGNAGIIRALETHPRKVTFIAHELSPVSRRGLLKGTVDAIISQDAAHEVRSVLRVLSALCEDQAIVESQERIRIEIFLRDNLPPME